MKQWIGGLVFAGCLIFAGALQGQSLRERISIDDDWRFTKGDPTNCKVSLLYDVLPKLGRAGSTEVAPDQATAPKEDAGEATNVIKQWVLPSGNDFIKDPAKRFTRPAGNLGDGVAYVQPDFDDHSWQKINLPHDWAIEGPFNTQGGGGMGRLPTVGIGWYRKSLTIPAEDAGKRIYLDVDGAMAYAAVWLNGRFVGGWPFGYQSWELDLTPYVKPGMANKLGVRLENLPNSSRWYPGAGIYRNVWLVKTAPVHVEHWGTYVTAEVSDASGTAHLKVTVRNDSNAAATASVTTEIFAIETNGVAGGTAVSSIAPVDLQIEAGSNALADGTATIANPRLWQPMPDARPYRYLAVTTVSEGGKPVDVYETKFGIRTLKFDPNEGLFVNGRHVPINGVCDHHDLGALGTALNYRALQRQLEMLRDMGCNAIRTSHNPPAPELLEMADEMGFLVMDEAFDVWERRKTPLDFHLIFQDWHEQDLRAQMRRDRNHPCVFLWSIGNEVGEQFTREKGAEVSKMLGDIAHDEDPTRPTTTAMNWSQPTNPFTASVDAIGLNYQGAGIRGVPGQYPAFHKAFPNTFIYSSESASALSSRGVYTFPVTTNISAAVGAKSGEDRTNHEVSAYELYAAAFGSSADKVFASQEASPFAGGEFVWTGWDYLGEPTPFDTSRSSYSGIIDLAGFKKDRYYDYQAHWRPEFPMAHILPHWTWPERVGQVTPVHVFTSGDEAELFLNGKSLGRKKKGEHEYRLRWDDVVYEPGALKVVAYKNGAEWGTDTMTTAGDPARLKLEPDRNEISADGRDFSFVTLTVTDKAGVMAPRADNRVRFEIKGPGEIVATDNGDPADMESFKSSDRKAFNGLCLVIVRGNGKAGKVTIMAKADGLKTGSVSINTK